MELNPHAKKKFFRFVASPSKYLLSGVKLSGPLKNNCIPDVSNIGRRLTALFKIGSKCSKSSGN